MYSILHNSIILIILVRKYYALSFLTLLKANLEEMRSRTLYLLCSLERLDRNLDSDDFVRVFEMIN